MKKKYRRYIFLAIIAVLLLAPALVLGPYWLSVQHIEADPLQGFHADFYLYVSPQARRKAKAGKPVTLLVQPNNSGNSDDPEFHRKDAWWMGFGRHGLADELGVALLVPAFVRPAQDWHIYTHALDRDVFTTGREDLYRTDLQLLAMVTAVREKLAATGLPTNHKFLLQGYSASGMFVNRFTALHPEHILAVAAGSPGGWPIAPVAEYQGRALPYPAGIADIDSLSGKAFNAEAYKKVPQLLVMGALDDNDSLDFTDGWEEETAALVKRLFGPDPVSRWHEAGELYRRAGADAHFLLVKNIGHDRKKLQPHTTAFFEEILANLK